MPPYRSEEAQLLESCARWGNSPRPNGSAAHQDRGGKLLQPLRDEEATRAAVLHRIQVERDTLDREEVRAKERETELKARYSADPAGTQSAKMPQLLRRASCLPGSTGRKRPSKSKATGPRRAQKRRSARMWRLGETERSRSGGFHPHGQRLRSFARIAASLETQISEHNSRASRFAAQEAEIGRQVAELKAKAGASSPVDELREDVAMLEDQLETLEGDIIAAEETVSQSRAREKDTRDAAQAAGLKAKSLETEVATLIKLLKPAEAGRFKPIVDHAATVSSGFEIALGAALGDDLDVTADQEAPIRWTLISDTAGDPALSELK